MNEPLKSLREELAKLAHSQWSGWMEYLFSKCEVSPDGTMTIPKWAVDRWSRQVKTKYDDLDQSEKDSDRTEADKFIEVINRRAFPAKEAQDGEDALEQRFAEIENIVISNTVLSEMVTSLKNDTMSIIQAYAARVSAQDDVCGTCGYSYKHHRVKDDACPEMIRVGWYDNKFAARVSARQMPDLTGEFGKVRLRLINHIEWWESVECRCESLIGYMCDRCAHIELDQKSIETIDRIEKAIKGE